MIKGIVIGFILAIAISVSCVFIYSSTGLAPVATADPPMPFEKKFANMALDAHIEKQHIPPSSLPADEPNFLSGATVYKQHCALCHGLPGQPPIDYATTQPIFPRFPSCKSHGFLKLRIEPCACVSSFKAAFLFHVPKRGTTWNRSPKIACSKASAALRSASADV